MEDLNKQQIVLLTLLVSFVTSIATGITTVSLLDQAPKTSVPQTINRIVERTVEKVVEPDLSDQEEKIVFVETTPEKEVVTVIVNEEDAQIESVQKNLQSLVRVYVEGRSKSLAAFAGLAVITDSSGTILMDRARINPREDYIAVYPNGQFELDIVEGGGPGISFIPKIPADQGNVSFKAAEFANSNELQLAQSVILLSGQPDNNVLPGVITALNTTGEGEAENVVSVKASTPVADVLSGSIIVTLSGKVAGMSFVTGSNEFVASNTVASYRIAPVSSNSSEEVEVAPVN